MEHLGQLQLSWQQHRKLHVKLLVGRSCVSVTMMVLKLLLSLLSWSLSWRITILIGIFGNISIRL